MEDKRRFRLTTYIVFFLLVFLATALVGFYFGLYANSNSKSSEPINNAPNNSNLAPLTKPTVIGLAGDIMLGRTVEIEAKKKKDFSYSFRNVAPITQASDIFFANLENPIIENCNAHTSGFKFCANPEMIEGLTNSGVDIVTLANNHTNNYGNSGFGETLRLLDSNGINITGNENLEIIKKNGTTFGFIGFDKAQITNPVLSNNERALVIESDKQVDILIVAPHWGVEYKNTALPGVKKLAKELIALGADAIIGSHSHWVQEAEFFDREGNQIKHQTASELKQKQTISFQNESKATVPVYYSLGNFVFDQSWSEETKKGLYVELVYEDIKLVEVKEYPTYMKNHAQPEFVN